MKQITYFERNELDKGCKCTCRKHTYIVIGIRHSPEDWNHEEDHIWKNLDVHSLDETWKDRR